MWTRTGHTIARWDTDASDALFGHVALAVPDLDGDGRADVIVSAPNAVIDGEARGFVDAYGSRDGSRLWRAVGALYDGFGWHVSRAADVDGDGVEDLWVGAPSNPAEGHAYIISGRDGHIIRAIAGPAGAQFGWYLVATGDLDDDGVPDVAVGAPTELVAGARRGAVHLVSSTTGDTIRTLHGELPTHRFGEMLAALDDLDGDAIGDLAIAAIASPLDPSSVPGEVSLISAATGARLRLLPETEPGELYGRMLARVPDLDGDGIGELAIGAPWWGARDGRIEVRSPTTLAVVAELRGRDRGWLGWHIAAAGTSGILVSQLHAADDAGAIELYELR